MFSHKKRVRVFLGEMIPSEDCLIIRMILKLTLPFLDVNHEYRHPIPDFAYLVCLDFKALPYLISMESPVDSAFSLVKIIRLL
jgi:hypothetical protein